MSRAGQPSPTPYPYDADNPPYLSRILNLVFIVQSPIPPGQLSPELVPHKFPVELLHKGLASLKNQLACIPTEQSSLLVTPKKTEGHQNRLTNEQLTIDQIGQLPENSPTVMSREEFEAFFRILNCARELEAQSPLTPVEGKPSIEVIPRSSSPTINSAKRSRENSSLNPKAAKKARRTTATFAQKIEVLNWYHANGQSQTGTAKHFDSIYPELRIKQPLVSAWAKDEAHIRAMAPPGSTTAKRVRGTTHPEVTAMLEEWVQQAILAKVNITGEVICEKWKEFAKLCEIPSAEWLSLSHGWLDAFRQRNGLRHLKQACSVGSVSGADREPVPEVARLLSVTHLYAPEDVYNMDETGLFYAMPPDKELVESQATEDEKQLKTRLTIVLATNVDGTDRLPLLIIGKTEERTQFTPTDPEANIEYRQNAKGIMTSMIFQQWITSWNQKLLSTGHRPVLLLVDTSDAHILPAGVALSHIRVESLSSSLHPLAMGIVQCFKSHYRRRCTFRAIQRSEEVDPADVYAIDAATAMRLCRNAWNAVPARAIQNAWASSGLVDHYHPDLPVAQEPESTVQEAGAVAPNSESLGQASGPLIPVPMPAVEATEAIVQAPEDVIRVTQPAPEPSEDLIQVFEPAIQRFQPATPEPDPKPLIELTTELQADLRILQDIGVLSPQNAMRLTDLINPPGESFTDSTLWTPEQIFTRLRNSAPAPVTTDGSHSIQPKIEETLSAVQKILNFLESDDSREGQALEPLLENFARRLGRKNINGRVTGASGLSPDHSNSRAEQQHEGISESNQTQARNDQALITNFFELAQPSPPGIMSSSSLVALISK